MVLKVVDLKQNEWYCSNLVDNIPDEDIVFLITYFVLSNKEVIYQNVTVSERGRPSNPPEYMLALLIYGSLRHINSTDELAEMAEFHQKFRYVSGDIKPSGRSLRDFRKKYGNLYKQLIAITLNFAYDVGLTNFDHICIDGTIIKATNSPFNVIYREDALILLNNLEKEDPDLDEIKELRKPAKKLYYNKVLKNDKKIALLKKMIKEMDNSLKDKIPAFEIESRTMKTKKGYYEPSYNMQLATDTESKLICAVHITNKATDHFQLPPTIDKALENLPLKPDIVSADNIYKTPFTLEYLEDNQIKGLIPDREQTRKSRDKNDALFHKDNFTYDFRKDAFICPANQILKHESTIYEETKDENHTKIQVNSYYNYDACKNCKYKEQCTPKTSEHRVIQERTSPLIKKMKYEMEKEENKKEYKKRGYTAEPPNGTLKEQFHINQVISNGLEDKENKITLKALAYNLTVIYNQLIQADETITFKKLVKYELEDLMIELTQEFEDIQFKVLKMKEEKSNNNEDKK